MNEILIWIIIICIVLSIIMLFPRFFKFIGKFALNAAIGLFIIWIVNYFIQIDTMKVGLNYVTAAVTGLLGLPGVATLYIIQFII